jgi:hypothetical protein
MNSASKASGPPSPASLRRRDARRAGDLLLLLVGGALLVLVPSVRRTRRSRWPLLPSAVPVVAAATNIGRA